MLAVSTVMYTVSAIHWALNMALAAKSMRAGAPLVSRFETLVVVYLPTINVRYPLKLHLRRLLIAVKYILSDGIVMWRAWVVWGPSRRFAIFTPPVLSLVCTLSEYEQTVGDFLS